MIEASKYKSSFGMREDKITWCHLGVGEMREALLYDMMGYTQGSSKHYMNTLRIEKHVIKV